MTDLKRQERLIRAITVNKRDLSTAAYQKLLTDDFYTLILRGHSLIQASLFDAVRIKSTNRPMFDQLQLEFVPTTYLAVAFNIIDETLVPFLLRLNKVRNKQAHGFEDPTAEDIRSIVNALPRTFVQKQLTTRGMKRPTFLDKFRGALIFIVLIAQFQETESEAARMIKYLHEQAQKEDA